MEGIVKWFNRKKGYGFIKGGDDKEYFVHYTAVPKGIFLTDNDKVSFDPVEGERGPQAQKVELIQKASESAKSEESSEDLDEAA